MRPQYKNHRARRRANTAGLEPAIRSCWYGLQSRNLPGMPAQLRARCTQTPYQHSCIINWVSQSNSSTSSRGHLITCRIRQDTILLQKSLKAKSDGQRVLVSSVSSFAKLLPSKYGVLRCSAGSVDSEFAKLVRRLPEETRCDMRRRFDPRSIHSPATISSTCLLAHSPAIHHRHWHLHRSIRQPHTQTYTCVNPFILCVCRADHARTNAKIHKLPQTNK